jgi:hypothetical protein
MESANRIYCKWDKSPDVIEVRGREIGYLPDEFTPVDTIDGTPVTFLAPRDLVADSIGAVVNLFDKNMIIHQVVVEEIVE